MQNYSPEMQPSHKIWVVATWRIPNAEHMVFSILVIILHAVFLWEDCNWLSISNKWVISALHINHTNIFPLTFFLLITITIKISFCKALTICFSYKHWLDTTSTPQELPDFKGSYSTCSIILMFLHCANGCVATFKTLLTLSCMKEKFHAYSKS